MELTEDEYSKLTEDEKRLYRRKQTKDGISTEVEKCAQELLLHVQSAKIATMIQRKIKKHIQTEWKQRNIVNSVRPIHCTKKQNNYE